MYDKKLLAPAGSTGNNTHTAVEVGGDAGVIGLQFVVEAVGATPAVTFKFQGSVDGTNWYDVAYVTDAVDTLAVVAVVLNPATVGAKIEFLANPGARRYTQYRLVTSANTNVTYRAEIFRGTSI